ncbi:MAG: arsenate reductase ArsC [Nitrosopumilus sp.]|jgi:protein-tyrosine-phosphatase|nr:arsenate reductase ArsC [Nitrosopumilus sp.]MBT3685540.1 arsenate reductase ArsC [Nitrosopumilus sp.]MBT3924921.1 arsenate reductase ArsC [Nitrosopumilus sp.]MBT4215939.1 arsenate reductase ArsC [Nitrosopumilus sp.]MBT4550261.1 arsenate reductase ArsC [Nitrosopumilus sp.]
MAEAFFKKHAKNSFNVVSAGTCPSPKIDPVVVSAMNEIGIDLKNQQPQLLSISMIKNSNKTVNMGCMDKESCPSLFVKDVDDWNMDDPKGKSLDDVRKIRDQIKHSVLNLLDSLECDN